MTPDWLLLRRYTREDSQEAFAALTARYLNLVYAVCLREVHDPTLAQDAAQAVFLLLARTAPSFRSKTALPGWLFRTAQFTAQNTRTREERHRRYEEAAAKEYAEMETPAGAEAWAEIEPLLNSSLAALRETDRACLLLRFFQEQSFAEVGVSLGLSEEAARKRVARSLDKMRRFFAKEGAVVPATALAALLTAHAAKAAPPTLAANLAVLIPGLAAGHLSAALTSSHAYQLSEGALKTMKLVQLKAVISICGICVVGVAFAGLLVHAVHAKPSQPEISLDDPINADKTAFQTPGEKDAVRNVILVGKACYEDGRPAAGVQIAAQMQNKAIQDQTEAILRQQGTPKVGTVTINFTKSQQEESWNSTVSKSDGTYQLPVAANILYNVMVFDTTGKWVAAAIEGTSGQENTTVQLPNLVLTKGALVVGKVTSISGLPVPYVMIGGYGSDRPATTAAANFARTDLSGNYRLRVAPGQTRVYVGLGSGESKSLPVKLGEIVTVDLQARP